MSTNSRIALFTPLRPVKSGIADYSEELCPLLNEHYDIDIFIEKYKPENKELKKIVNIYPASEFVWRNLQKPYAVNVYQMGNNTCHAYMYPYLFQYPGILVLHDYNLHHSRLKMAVDMHKLDEYGTEIAYCYPGEKGKVLADTVISGMGSRFQYFKFSYNKILIDASLLTAVHSTYVKEIIEKEAPAAQVAKITMGVPVIKPGKSRVGELRKKHKLQSDDIILASFGAVTPEKRIISIMKVFQKLFARHENIKYLLVGNRSEDLDIDQLVKDLKLEDKIIITGFVERGDFFNYLALADVCINMRYPTVRETSATLLRIMAMGKPVVISDLLHLGDIPEEISIKIPLIDEEEILYKKLRNIIKNKSRREKLSHAGLHCIREKHSLKAMRDSYVPVIEEGIKLKSKRQIDRSGFPEHLRGAYWASYEELEGIFKGFIKSRDVKELSKLIPELSNRK